MGIRLENPQPKGCVLTGTEVEFAEGGGSLLYPLKGSEEWRKHTYLLIEVENREEYSVCLEVGFWQEHTEKKSDLFVAVGILPRVSTTVCVPIRFLDGQTLFGPRRPGILKTVIKGNAVNLDRLKAMGISLPPSHKKTRLFIRDVRLANEEPNVELHTASLLDELGQDARRNWLGKTASREECSRMLLSLREEAERALAAAMDSYQGAPEQDYEATGFFRLDRDERGAHILVTPDGHAFFSSGVDCVNPNAKGPTDGDGQMRDFLVENLMHAFGDDWYEAWSTITKHRLLDWRVNTVAAWSDLTFARQAKLPYVAMLDDYPTTSHRIYRDFPDVFAAEYAEQAEAYACQLEPHCDDRYLIGYFMSNEPNWAFVDGLNLGYELLRNPAELVSRTVLLDFLKERYPTPALLNEAWGTGVSRLEELFELGQFPEVSEQAMADLEAFSHRMIEEYIKIPALALRKVDPHHLNLGIRYAYISSPALYSGSSYFDIFSINCYEKTCVSSVQKVYDQVGLPVMVGEFHFGAIDRGLPATGIRGAADQVNRGRAIRRYVEEAAALPCCVGVHYFQYHDQPYLGRFDGENYNIGLVDICSKEYAEVTDEWKRANERLYALRRGQTSPVSEEIAYMPAIFY
ncbi:hypothetical protein [Gorillibacterium sp. CAU 1737]|uniref:hypothetical protein n=1 Tax=Gorillibacterium sp. CAU 1737 TaxID=3140362 RepID=UPI003260446D